MMTIKNTEGLLIGASLTRRRLLLGAGALGVATALGRPQEVWAAATSIDHTIRIGPISVELAPGKIIKTTGYNGRVPGPVLRLK
ncbi:MAG: twin-arginine translocation signal domain-containing protein, partial [Acidobacteriota bacterium]|nr:twin-arginine translocation signal domain-containing protein [Acidobacteriota bacterium]